MKSMMKRMLQITAAGLLIVLIPAVCMAAEQAQPINPATAGEDHRQITFDFQNEDIGVFIRFVSEITGRNFLVDPRVRGPVTVVAPQRISAADLWAVFLSVLDVHGFTVVDARPAAKIVPAAEAVTKNVAMPAVLPAEDRLVTRVIPLFYTDANALKSILVPLVSQRGALVGVSFANLLVITDTASNILRLLTIINAIDVEDDGTRITLVPLQYADSREMAETLNRLFETRPKSASVANAAPVRFFAAERSNALLFRSSKLEVAGLEALIRTLDEKKPLDRGRVRIHRLSFARAEETAEVLASVATGIADPPKSVRIWPDAATNSLIVDADPVTHRSLTEVIGKLDAPRAMVYIEALLMEVSGDRDLQLGIEWSAAGERSLGGRDAFVGGGFRDQPDNTSLPALVGGGLPSGFTLGVFTEPVDIAGITFNNLSAILRVFQEENGVSILSTPQILAVDNEEARINISRNIPFRTSTSTEQNETFNSFEYQDVGTILKVVPHIGPKEQVRIDLDLEISAVQSQEDFKPTTLRRTLTNSVLLRSGQTMVIGGTVAESRSIDQRKTPFLGDLPAAGRLFRVDDDTKRANRFFVFLTPRIVRNPLQAAVQEPMPAGSEGAIPATPPPP